MPELIVKRRTSVWFGVLLLLAAAYCIQFAVLEARFVFTPIYYLCFVMLLLLVTANVVEDIEFTGLNFIPPKPPVVLIFWTVLLLLCFAYFISRGFLVDDPSRKARMAHLLVGLYLYAFSASAIFGSYFSGLGLRLFLKNPVVWLKYITVRSRGELDGGKPS